MRHATPAIAIANCASDVANASKVYKKAYTNGEYSVNNKLLYNLNYIV